MPSLAYRLRFEMWTRAGHVASPGPSSLSASSARPADGIRGLTGATQPRFFAGRELRARVEMTVTASPVLKADHARVSM